MAYQPTTFDYSIDKATGLRVYQDDRVQSTYLNLRVVSDLIHDVQVSANNDLLYVQNNVGVSAVKNQTAQVLASYVCKLLEGLASAFPAGTGAAIAAMIIGKITSATVSYLVKESDPESDIQQRANETRDGMDAIFGALKKEIDTMIRDLEKVWDKPYECEGYLGPEYKGTAYLHDFADFDGAFPDHNSPEYDDWHQKLAFECKYLVTRNLLPAKWKIKNLITYEFKEYRQGNFDANKHYDFDHQVYNPHTDEFYWCQHFQALDISGGSFGSYYEIESQENGAEHFMSWLRGLCLDKRNASNYKVASTYYNWAEKWYVPIVDNKSFAGVKIHQVILVDSNGDCAPSVLGSWLFIDDGAGGVLNKNGIANREDVYKNWGLSTV